MTTDGLRGMAIDYNRLNLPQQVSKGNDKLQYGYSADGQKREKKLNNATTQHYRGSMVYNNSGAPDYVITPEGMVRNVSGSWARQYNLTDHLGNVRAVLEPNSNVIQKTDYYPFGTAFEVVNPNKNKYLYGNKEYQDERIGNTVFGMYDSQARFYDPNRGGWPTLDPLAEKYYSVSPYAYCNNNPMRFIDPTGMDYWSTNDPQQIAAFVFSINMGANPDLSDWNYMPDEEFLSNDRFTFNDETETFYSSYGTVKDGETTVVGVSGTMKIELPYSYDADVQYDNLEVESSSLSSDIWKGTIIAVGVLAADDVTGIGIADDVAIPFVVAGGAIAAGVTWLYDQFAHKPKKQSTGKAGKDSHDKQYRHGGKKKFKNKNQRKGAEERKNKGKIIN